MSGKFTQSTINLMSALDILKIKNTKLALESLEMVFNIVINFNI